MDGGTYRAIVQILLLQVFTSKITQIAMVPLSVVK